MLNPPFPKQPLAIHIGFIRQFWAYPHAIQRPMFEPDGQGGWQPIQRTVQA